MFGTRNALRANLLKNTSLLVTPKRSKVSVNSCRFRAAALSPTSGLLTGGLRMASTLDKQTFVSENAMFQNKLQDQNIVDIPDA